ncbi:hypothetical protein [Gramella sp. KN1008]|uniref:hypothetical protein n=1 Tax=Gramella sp. KN1008 TaxID=2529298 RepID=UPI00103DD4BB|nr:hypothetical protein [Gramella sp. KN1008]TBW27386.1 hypothetical protein EZJ28_10440 [Gramella sp. KN1008]
MMRIKSIFLYAILFAGVLNILGCSAESEDELGVSELTATACPDFQNSFQEVMKEYMTYSQNPSEESCEDYKTVLMKFYEDYNKCPTWSMHYQKFVDDAKILDCSEESRGIVLPK